MPDAPPPPGGNYIPRDSEVRWIEPADPVFIEPELDNSLTSSPAAARDAVRWREVRWVDFVAPKDEGSEDRQQTWSVARALETVNFDEPRHDSALVEEAAVNAEAEPAHWLSLGAEPARPRQAQPKSRKLEVLLTRNWLDLLERSRSALGQIGSMRLNRVAQLCLGIVALTLILGLSYEGGERLAGLAGAMTPPQASGTQPQPAKPPRIPAAPVDEAGARAAWFLQRANGGDTTAQYNVAVLYARGEGLVQDFTSSAAWFEKAAAAGSPAAQFNLGVLYQRGLGVSQDSAAALRWYKRAAERHYAAAEYNLAIAYAEGRGTPRDPVAAARWYHLAAAQGLVPAMINFAILYEKGEGVERSPVDAYAWYRAAAQRGDKVGEKRAGELFAGFDAGSRKQAQSLAASIAGSIRQIPTEVAGVEAGSGEARTARN